MRDVLSGPETEIHLSDPNPMKRAQIKMRTPLPKRFYKEAKPGPFEGGFVVLLDGKPVKTPSGAKLILPTLAAAELVALEYGAQEKEVNPATMPVTRLANTAVDGVEGQVEAVLADIENFAGSDLVCYRSEGPEVLVELQAKAWDPYIAWANKALNARFFLAQGVMPIDQPAEAIAAISKALAKYHSAFAAACLHSMTTLTGSAILALAAGEGHVSAETAWGDAHVDEDWTISQWGADEEATVRRAYRWLEMKAAADLLAASRR
jgi:chaperone required for assembly of F1-ATPase